MHNIFHSICAGKQHFKNFDKKHLYTFSPLFKALLLKKNKK